MPNDSPTGPPDSHTSHRQSNCEAFEQAWQAGPRPRIEDFLSGAREPDLTTRVCQLVSIDVRQRIAVGERPHLDEYCRRFPNACRQLEQVFRSLVGLDDTAEEQRLREHFQRIGYRLAQEIGRGAFGRVYRAVRTRDATDVAIKILWPLVASSVERLKLFLRELEIHRGLDHPCIVKFLDCGEIDMQTAWFAMEYVPGTNLYKLVKHSGNGLALEDACSIVLQILGALDYAHSIKPPQGPLVHRDVKPGNVMVSGRPGSYVGKLVDFGLAKNFEQAGLSGMTVTGVSRGTLAYMPPKQTYDSKYAGPEVDIFAAGALLYFALCGETMYAFPSGAPPSVQLNHVLMNKIVPLSERRPDLPAQLIALVDRAVRVDDVRRIHSARQMHAALSRPLGRLAGN